MFGLIGFAVGRVLVATKFATNNVLRLAVYGLLGYLGYEFIVGFACGRQTAPPALAPHEAEPTDDAPLPAPARSVLTGFEKLGRTVDVVDAGGVAHRARVGRGVLRR